ncbi:unnamed protein product [Peniophora sp. CBMAI 1063]|nr:unnamed protein product [Peniophora sp. CBMAI 1063]
MRPRPGRVAQDVGATPVAYESLRPHSLRLYSQRVCGKAALGHQNLLLECSQLRVTLFKGRFQRNLLGKPAQL